MHIKVKTIHIVRRLSSNMPIPFRDKSSPSIGRNGMNPYLGLGYRMCAGSLLAYHELYITFLRMLSVSEIRADEPIKTHPLNGVANLARLASMPREYKVRFIHFLVLVWIWMSCSSSIQFSSRNWSMFHPTWPTKPLPLLLDSLIPWPTQTIPPILVLPCSFLHTPL